MLKLSDLYEIDSSEPALPRRITQVNQILVWFPRYAICADRLIIAKWNQMKFRSCYTFEHFLQFFIVAHGCLYVCVCGFAVVAAVKCQSKASSAHSLIFYIYANASCTVRAALWASRQRLALDSAGSSVSWRIRLLYLSLHFCWQALPRRVHATCRLRRCRCPAQTTRLRSAMRPVNLISCGIIYCVTLTAQREMVCLLALPVYPDGEVRNQRRQ